MAEIIVVTAKIDVSKVKSAYSGHPGCACGCQGTYFYAKKFQEQSGNTRGYEVRDEEVNDYQVERIVKLFNRIIEDKSAVIYQYPEYPNFLCFDKSDVRTYTVYLG